MSKTNNKGAVSSVDQLVAKAKPRRRPRSDVTIAKMEYIPGDADKVPPASSTPPSSPVVDMEDRLNWGGHVR